jgi:hypothetical protein
MLSANALARDAAIFRGVRRDVRRPHALVPRRRTSSEADEACGCRCCSRMSHQPTPGRTHVLLTQYRAVTVVYQ